MRAEGEESSIFVGNTSRLQALSLADLDDRDAA
jgi:hypothetical protein